MALRCICPRARMIVSVPKGVLKTASNQVVEYLRLRALRRIPRRFRFPK